MNEMVFALHILAVFLAVFAFSFLEKPGLFVIFVLQIIFADLFILKQTELFGLIVTTTDCFTIGSFITLNLIRESYGKEASDKAIITGLCSMLFLPFMSFFLLKYSTISENISMHTLYESLLLPSTRIFIVSLICMASFQKLDTFIFFKLRNSFSVNVAMFFSLCISQLLDTYCFTYGALSGVMTNLSSIALFSYFIKVITISVMTPTTKLLIRKIS
jgi:uncharacterized integral membrane protein (TIGR00697 family)